MAVTRSQRAPRRLSFAPGLLERIRVETAAWAPLETGWIGVGLDGSVERLVPAGPHARRTPTSFLPDLAFQEWAIRFLRDGNPGLRPLVFIHSHPEGPSRPSDQDRSTAEDACAESGARTLDIAICAPSESGELAVQGWRYRTRRRSLRRLDLTQAPGAPPEETPFAPGFAWQRTAYGSERLLSDLYALHRVGAVPELHALPSGLVAVAAREPERVVFVLPRAYPFEPPSVFGERLQPLASATAWNSCRTLADLHGEFFPIGRDAEGSSLGSLVGERMEGAGTTRS